MGWSVVDGGEWGGGVGGLIGKGEKIGVEVNKRGEWGKKKGGKVWSGGGGGVGGGRGGRIRGVGGRCVGWVLWGGRWGAGEEVNASGYSGGRGGREMRSGEKVVVWGDGKKGRGEEGGGE